MFNILRASLRTGRVTVPYPEVTTDEPCRGRLQTDSTLCDACGTCTAVCPAAAIDVEQYSAAASCRLDLARCVFCGLCVDACPSRAITMTNDFEMAVRSREALIVRARTSDESEVTRVGEQLGKMISSRLKRSLHIRHMAAGSDNSSDWEIAHLLNPVHDIQRLGIDFVASPRHADLLLVTGAVTRNLEPALRATYEAMPAPRLVVAVGAEACGGGVLQGAYAVAGGVDRCLPVDVYIPGDPPRPQAIIQGLLVALGRMEPKLQ